MIKTSACGWILNALVMVVSRSGCLPTADVARPWRRRDGISYQEVVAGLESDGVEKFIASWDELVHTVSSALAAAR
jgi:hypothetical protein